MRDPTALKDLKGLPDFPVLREVAAALWRRSAISGAAVMVGAGLSRVAELPTPTSLKPPLWAELSAEMRRRLGDNLSPAADPLRLAEEYRSALGQSALDSLIRDLVQDAAYKPSAAHRRLLTLPWTDVLTTNWDTLLERTSLLTNTLHYGAVHTIEDIARTRSPRIVKLHGGFPSGPFIVAEEDYRTYPRRRAPFVNLVQQVLLENELCLLGFSGDDPNFLRWAGWVRDKLGDAARPIRLIGRLGLTAARRRYLENLNVTPIDLAPIIDARLGPDQQHQRALEIALEYLHAERPASPAAWRFLDYSKNEPAAAAVRGVSALLETLSAERRAYPGWVMPPFAVRTSLQRTLGGLIEKIEKLATNLDDELHRRLVFEGAWRLDMAAEACPESFATRLADAIDKADPYREAETIGIAGRLLLRSTRERADVVKFGAAHTLLTRCVPANREVELWIAYEQALFARDRFDPPATLAALEELRSDEPAWLLKGAALRCALGQYGMAEDMITRSVATLHERRARDPRSAYLSSLEAWALWIFRHMRWDRSNSEPDSEDSDASQSLETSPSHDPWREIEYFEQAMRPGKKEDEPHPREEKKKRFDPGTYTHSRQTQEPDYSHRREPFDEMRRVVDAWGVPEGVDMVNILGHQFEEMLEMLEPFGIVSSWEVARYASRHEDGIVDWHFERSAVALMDSDQVRALLQALRQDIEFCWRQWSEHDHLADSNKLVWVQRARVHLEIASRLAVRLSADEAGELLRWGLRLASHRGLEHWWLFKPLSHLLRRSLSVIAPSERPTLLTSLLKLPLPGEHGERANERDWPELIDLLPEAPAMDRRSENGYASRVYQLIRAARSDDIRRREAAIRRLAYLYRNGGLSDAEATDFGEALWSLSDQPFELPRVYELAPWLFLALPAPDRERATSGFQKDVVQRLVRGGGAKGSIRDLASAALPPEKGGVAFALTPADATEIIGRYLQPSGGEEMWEFVRVYRPFDIALADALLPAIKDETAAVGLATRLVEFADPDDEDPRLLICLSTLAQISPANRVACVQILRRGLISRDEGAVVDALDGVQRWTLLEERSVPRELLDDVVRNCVMRHSAALWLSLRTAAELQRQGMFNEDQQRELRASLGALRREATYEKRSGLSANEGEASLIRRSCVLLAHSLRERSTQSSAIGYWLEAATMDPLPEVRHALDDYENRFVL